MRTGISTTSYKFDKKKEIEFKQFEPFDFWEFWVTNGFTCQYILEKCKKEWNIRKYHLSYFLLPMKIYSICFIYYKCIPFL